MRTLILASRSPRRSRILNWGGIPFKVRVPAGVEERRNRGERPDRMVRRLALLKARAASAENPGALVLAADTAVALQGKIFGKPRNPVEARRMLLALEGREHQVWTGVALLAKRGSSTFVECTRVRFGRIPRKELQAYLKTGTPYDKAGGYDIQGRAGEWITGIRGDFFNVMGLPLKRVLRELAAFGAR